MEGFYVTTYTHIRIEYTLIYAINLNYRIFLKGPHAHMCRLRLTSAQYRKFTLFRSRLAKLIKLIDKLKCSWDRED